MTPITKTLLVQQAIRTGDRKAALKLASDFRIGISSEQRKVLKTGYECIVHPAFYKQLKVDTEAAVNKAWTLLVSLPVIQ